MIIFLIRNWCTMTTKFPNWQNYSNTTDAICQGWMAVVREKVNLCDVEVSTCLVAAYEDYSFGEVSFFFMSKVSEWNKEQWLNFV